MNSPALALQECRAVPLRKGRTDGGEAEGRREGVRVRVKGAIPAHAIGRQLQRALFLHSLGPRLPAILRPILGADCRQDRSSPLMHWSVVNHFESKGNLC